MLLLCPPYGLYGHNSLSAADAATSEMNGKEKAIIRAYLRAVRYATHLESRVRIVLVGDSGTGEHTHTHTHTHMHTHTQTPSEI